MRVSRAEVLVRSTVGPDSRILRHVAGIIHAELVAVKVMAAREAPPDHRSDQSAGSAQRAVRVYISGDTAVIDAAYARAFVPFDLLRNQILIDRITAAEHSRPGILLNRLTPIVVRNNLWTGARG